VTRQPADADIPPGLDWPVWADPTPPTDREHTRKFDTRQRQTEQHLQKEMERMDVSTYHLGKTTGQGGFPGVVARWSKDGREYAVCCDQYTTRSDNLRAIYLWVEMKTPNLTGQFNTTDKGLPDSDFYDGPIAAYPEDGDYHAHLSEGEVIICCRVHRDTLFQIVDERSDREVEPDTDREGR
jgi:hypothetical protein